MTISDRIVSIYNLLLSVFSRNLNMPPPSRLVNLLVENRSLYATYGKRYGQFVDNPHVDKYAHLYRYYLDIIEAVVCVDII